MLKVIPVKPAISLGSGDLKPSQKANKHRFTSMDVKRTFCFPQWNSASRFQSGAAGKREPLGHGPTSESKKNDQSFRKLYDL